MASCEEDSKEENERRFGRIVKAWIGCLASFTLSLIGGLMLTWWELKYHPANDQQWMVPLGLILLVTPLIVCFSVFISDFCNSIDISTHNNSRKRPLNDPER